MTAALHAKIHFHGADHSANRWSLDLAKINDRVVFADLFEPSFWRHHTKKFHDGDLIRVIAADRSFDLMLVVAARSPGGVMMGPWPYPAIGSAEWLALMSSADQAKAAAAEALAAELSPDKLEKRAAA